MKIKYNTILNNTNFLKIWSSQLLSQLTINISTFLLINQIYEITSSTISVAILWLSYSLPAVLFGPFSGFLVDLWSKKKIMMLANFLQAAIIGSIFFITEKYYLLYAGVFAYSLINQFYIPAQLASIPSLVKKANLPVANSLFLLTAQLSLLIGFGGGSILIKLLPRDTIIGLGSAFLLLAAFSLSFLPSDKSFVSVKKKYKNNLKNWFEEIKSSWSYLSHQGKLILVSFGIMALFQITSASFSSIIPAISKEILNTSLKEAAAYLVPPLVVGLLLGGFLFSKLAKKQRKKDWISLGFGGAGVTLITVVIIEKTGIPLHAHPITLSFLLFLLGSSASLVLIPSQTFIQEFTPAAIRGRVFGLLGVTTNLAAIVPVLTIATIIDIIGVRFLLLIIGLLCLAVNIFIYTKGNAIIFNTNHRA